MHDQEEIVISGVSGRFPKSSNVNEFGENLFNGIDLVTESDLRWPPGIYGLPKRHGKLKEINKFDASFFGITPKQANNMDPQIRKLLEVSWEAVLDSGNNPSDFRGTKTGVFVGCSGGETGSILSRDPDKISGYSLVGTVNCMFSNWISYALDLRGPSFAVDSACSSSLQALDLALDAIRKGRCDSALVAGSHLNISPMTSLQFWRFGMLSSEGRCRSFDDSADGYCRTEGVAAIFIQKRSIAKRIYFTILHAKSDTDGYKEEGISFPSGDRQATLLKEVYAEAGIDPNEVFYVEAHGTGTKVGDPQEAMAISEVFCSNRKNALLIGSVKSNMGHPEPAAGICGIVKLIIAREKGLLPPNLHFQTPNSNIPSLVDHRLQVVTEATPFEEGIVGVNSFGFGGSKTHVILKADKIKINGLVEKCSTSNETHIFLYAGRTSDGIKKIFNYFLENSTNLYFRQLLTAQANLLTKDALYRGVLVYNRENNFPPIIDVQKTPSTNKRQIWFVYTGIGSQWAGMAQKLLQTQQFAKSIKKSSEALKEFGKDVYEMLKNPLADQYKNNPTNCMITIAAIQIALTDILNELGITPDGIIGKIVCLGRLQTYTVTTLARHSFGETCCAYADDALTRDQVMKSAYFRGSTIMAQKYPVEGSMAAVGLSWEDAKAKCFDGVFPACHNGLDSTTVSGEVQIVNEFCEQLQSEGVFTQLVDCSGIPFHSPYLYVVKESLFKNMSKIIPSPKRRSPKWISSSVSEKQIDDGFASYCSPEYIVNNVCGEVYFYEALQHIPANSIIIEIAPHCLMQAILRRNVPNDCSIIGLMNKHADNEVESFFKSIGKIYQAGANVHIEKFYPQLPFPVPTGTPMIAPLWTWDHGQDWYIANTKKILSENCWSTYNIDPFSLDTKESFLLEHVVGSRLLYPFTGYIVLAWKSLCKLKGVDYLKSHVVLTDFVVHRAVFITKTTQLDVISMPESGDFEIIEDGQLVANGKICIQPENDPNIETKDFSIKNGKIDLENEILLNADDFYKIFILRGYDFGPSFKCIKQIKNDGSSGTINWHNNWVTFLDALIQTFIIAEPHDLWNIESVKLPVKVGYLEINPILHENFIRTTDEQSTVEFFNMYKIYNKFIKNSVKAGGVKLFDVQFHSVIRRTKTKIKGKHYMEKLLFVKNIDDRTLDTDLETRSKLSQYINYIYVLINNGLNKWCKYDLFKCLKNGEKFLTAIENMKNLKYDQTVDNIDDYLKDDKCQFVKFIDEVFLHLENAHESESDLCEEIYERAKKFSPIIDFDHLWVGDCLNDRILKSAVDICIENSCGYGRRFAAVEISSINILKHFMLACENQIAFDFSWVCIGPMGENLKEDLVNYPNVQTFDLLLDGNEFKNRRETRNFDALFLSKVLYWVVQKFVD